MLAAHFPLWGLGEHLHVLGMWPQVYAGWQQHLKGGGCWTCFFCLLGGEQLGHPKRLSVPFFAVLFWVAVIVLVIEVLLGCVASWSGQGDFRSQPGHLSAVFI